MKIPTVSFLKIPFVNLSAKEILEYLKHSIDTYTPVKVCYLSDKGLLKTIFSKKRREYLKSFHIIIPRNASLVKRLRKIDPHYSYDYKDTQDLIGSLLGFYKDSHHSFMFLGGEQVALNRLKVNIQASFPGFRLMGLYSEDFVKGRTEDIRTMMRKGDVRVLYLGMGSPKDEKWVLDNLDVLESPIVICVDKELRAMAGEITGIPLSVRKEGKERSYNFKRNPFRLFLFYRPIILSIARLFIK